MVSTWQPVALTITINTRWKTVAFLKMIKNNTTTVTKINPLKRY
jgi:hypothetical protein